jgi:hypothetical protein
MAFKIKRFISPLHNEEDPKPIKNKPVITRKTKEKITPPAAKKQVDKLAILAKRYPGYKERRPVRGTEKFRPNQYHLYNAKTGDSMTVRPDFGQNRKKNKE